MSNGVSFPSSLTPPPRIVGVFLPPSLSPALSLSLTHKPHIEEGVRNYYCSGNFLFFFSPSRILYLSAWHKCTSILRTCGVPACHANEGSLARRRKGLCASTLPPATWLFLCGFTLSGQVHNIHLQCIWILAETKKCMETHRSLFYNLLQHLPLNCECYTLLQRGLCHFPHATMHCL